MYQKKYHIHFVGIGGIGMSGIAELLLNLGYKVSGSDLALSDITRRLEKLGGKIFEGHFQDHIKGADVVVTSSAVRSENPEVIAAQEATIPVIPRAKMLAELMRLKYSVAVAGAHGKTTTTSLVAAVLGEGGLDPTVVIGGKLKSLGTNALLGKGDFIVAEADESDGSFLNFSPTIAVITNVDSEHLDFYKDLDEIKEVFLNFIDRIPFYGLAVLCLDNNPVQELIPNIKKRFITYGTSAQSDFRATSIKSMGLKNEFKVEHLGKLLGTISLNLAGLHNVYNALASIAVGMEFDIPFDVIKSALNKVEGVQRRMEIKGEAAGVTIVDDYGHHPTEIKTTLEAVKESWPDRRSVVVFQPHRYTRTKALFAEFTKAFYQSDMLVVLPIYSAGEKIIADVNSELLYEGIKKHGHKNVVYMDGIESVVSYLTGCLKEKDILLTLGAGDVYKVGEKLLESL